MKDKIELDEQLDESVILWVTDTVKVNKNTQISVPINHKAVAIVNEKVAFRVDPCEGMIIVNAFDKTLMNKKVKFVYSKSTALPSMAWGFGNIQVNNERLKEAYRVGVNGKYVVEINDIAKFLKCFSNVKEVTIDDVREKTVGIVRTNGVPILSKCFANTNISVFEIDSKLQEIREDLKLALATEDVFKSCGLKLVELTVEKVHVNEEDLQIIRDRLNG